MTKSDVTEALSVLRQKFPPPSSPLFPSGEEDANLPPLPNDFLEFLRIYGSGSFEGVDEDEIYGELITILNPYEPNFWKKEARDVDTISVRRKSGGPLRMSSIPEPSDLFVWAYGDCRKHYCWLTKGEPSAWQIVVIYDFDVVTRFDMPTTVFLKKLLCGELDAEFLGFPPPENFIDPNVLKFSSHVRP